MDDFNFFSSNIKIETVQKILRKSVNYLKEWSKTIDFNFSLEKLQCIAHLFTKNKKNKALNIKMEQQQIQVYNSIKIFGITLDTKLI